MFWVQLSAGLPPSTTLYRQWGHDCLVSDKNSAWHPGGHYWSYQTGTLSFSRSHCNSFEEEISVDEIYGYLMFKWVAVTGQDWEGTWVLVIPTINELINPLRAKFFRGNINMYSHFMSFLHIVMTQVVEIFPQVRQGPAHSTVSIMAADDLAGDARSQLGHRQPWYLPCWTGLIWSLHIKG